ncbi:MAG TPA: NAD-dependent epimerase/dehydratase family protein [Candidatus Limnocylindrales bacterium]|nr:NAD-dependent epimerase/dehydratase family protein [Candidatus Limnocylindrales bacterium]
MRRALITGGAGFIGSTLADRLLADGWTVTAVDAFEPFYPRARKLANLRAALTQPRFRLVEADTRDRAAIRAAILEARPDVVVDLAARAGVRPSIADPWTYIEINVGGLQNTLAAVAETGARLVFGSSSSIYGDDPRQPFREDEASGRPISPYGATKVAGEALVHAHHALTGLPVGIARLFTVYGPRQRPDLAIHSFAVRMLRGQPIDLYANGQASRDYTYVDDAVDALVRLASVGDPFLVVNVGSHRPIPTSTVVDELERALGVRAIRRLLPPQPGDVRATYADVSRAVERLGWTPRTPFPDGIDRFCAWLRREWLSDPLLGGAPE